MTVLLVYTDKIRINKIMVSVLLEHISIFNILAKHLMLYYLYKENKEIVNFKKEIPIMNHYHGS